MDIKKIFVVLLVLSFLLVGCENMYDDQDVPSAPMMPGASSNDLPVGKAYVASMSQKGLVDPEGIMKISETVEDKTVSIYDNFFVMNNVEPEQPAPVEETPITAEVVEPLPDEAPEGEPMPTVISKEGKLKIEVSGQDFVSQLGLLYNRCDSDWSTCEKLRAKQMPYEGECCNGWQVFYFDGPTLGSKWKWVNPKGATITKEISQDMIKNGASIQFVAIYSCNKRAEGGFDCHGGWPAHYFKVRQIDSFDDSQDACNRFGFKWVKDNDGAKCCGNDENEFFDSTSGQPICCDRSELIDGKCPELPEITMFGENELERMDTCQSSDGWIYKQGTTKLNVAIEGQMSEAADYCKDENTLIEYYCSGDVDEEIKPEEVECKQGCQDGACKTIPITVTGRLVDAESGNAVSGLMIEYYDDPLERWNNAYTDSDGKFALNYYYGNYLDFYIYPEDYQDKCYFPQTSVRSTQDPEKVTNPKKVYIYTYFQNIGEYDLFDAGWDLGAVKLFPAAKSVYNNLNKRMADMAMQSCRNSVDCLTHWSSCEDDECTTITRQVPLGVKVKPILFPFNEGRIEGDFTTLPYSLRCKDVALDVKDGKLQWLVGGDETDVKDKWQIAGPSNTLEIGESFDSVLSKVGQTQLSALKSESVESTAGGSAKYDQYIGLEDGSVTFTKNTASSSGAQGVGTYLYYPSAATFMNYSMIFTDAWDASLATTTSSDVTYFEEDKLKILGKEWVVVDATRPAVAREDSLKLVLIGDGVPITMSHNKITGTGLETQTISVDDVSYEVSVAQIYSDKAFITVNGLTSEVNLGDIKLFGDVYVGITKISTSSKEAIPDVITFVVGARKLELRDDEIQDNTASSYQLKVGSGSSVPYSNVIIKGTDDNYTVEVNEIDINLFTDRAYYLDGADYKSLKDVVYNTYLKQAMEALGVDVKYEGLTLEEGDTTIAISGGSSQYNLEFKNTAGNMFNLPLVYKKPSATSLMWGDLSNRLTLKPNEKIKINERFILTADANDPQSDTDVLTYTSSTYDPSTDDLTVELEGMSGSYYTVVLNKNGAQYLSSVFIDSVSYQFSTVGAAANDCDIKVARDVGVGVYNTLITQGGVRIDLTDKGNALIPGEILFALVDKNKQMVDSENSPNPKLIEFSFTQPASGDTYIQMARVLPSATAWKQNTGESTTYRFTNQYGIDAVFENPAGASQTARLEVPMKQRLPLVYVTTEAKVEPNAAPLLVPCHDDDGGKDYYSRGKGLGLYGNEKQQGVIWGEEPSKCDARWDPSLSYSVHYDCCSDSANNKQLNEAYCDAQGTLQAEGYECPNGCKDGACLAAPEPAPAQEVQEYTLTLRPGYNLISLPLEPVEKDISKFFQPIEQYRKPGGYLLVKAQNGITTETYPGTLTTVSAGVGYQIILKDDIQPISFTYTGTPVDLSEFLKGYTINGKGYSLIGIPTLSSYNVADIPVINDATIDTFYTYKSDTTVIDYSDLSLRINNPTTLESGKGYWIHITSCTDSDETDYSEKGIVTDIRGIYYDECINATAVKEFYCKDKVYANLQEYNCPNAGCSDGMCVE